MSSESEEPNPQPKKPKPQPDWQAIQVAYCQGFPLKEIAAKFGVVLKTLKKRIERGKWTTMKKTVIESKVIITKQASEAAAKLAADSVRPLLHNELRRLIDSPAMQKPTNSLESLDTKANVVLKFAQTGKILEGWNDEQTHTLRSISVLQASSDDERADKAMIALGLVPPPSTPDVSPQPCIDVASSSVPTVQPDSSAGIAPATATNPQPDSRGTDSSAGHGASPPSVNESVRPSESA